MSNPVEQGPTRDITGDLVRVAEVLDRAAVPMGLLGTDGVVVYTNEAFARASGRPAGELLGVALSESLVADDRGGFDSEVSMLCGDSTSRPGVEVRFVGVDGRVRATRLNLALLSGDLATALSEAVNDRRSDLVMCVATDRSEERRRERGNRRARVAETISAMTDPSTGLLNELGMEQMLESASRRAGRNGSFFALVHCNLGDAPGGAGRSTDGLSSSGPTGYEALLMTCAERIRQRLRPSDTVARSDDSIMVVAEDLGDEQDAAGVTYRVLSTVVEPVPTENGPVMVRMHAGTVVADGSTPLHDLASAAATAADAAGDGGFELVDMRR